jgi:hypothetical protein
VDIVTVFAISHHDEPKKPKVDAIKNNRLIPNYLQTCSSTFCIYIVENIYIFILFLYIFLRRMITNCIIPRATPLLRDLD